MQSALSRILHEPDYAASLAASGLETIRRRHTCAHRVDELFNIVGSVRDAREERAFTV
jgi:spore maturation protein CgeB